MSPVRMSLMITFGFIWAFIGSALLPEGWSPLLAPVAMGLGYLAGWWYERWVASRPRKEA